VKTPTDSLEVDASGGAGARLPRAFYRDQADAVRYQRVSLAYLVAIYGLLGVAMAGLAPVWLLVLLVPPLYVRTALSAHELMHVCPAGRVSFVHRLMMILDTPVGLGYREHRDIHMRHHRSPATERDPEFFQIRGGHLRALASSMVSPEWAFVRYLREKRLSRSWAAEASVRAAVFAALAWASPFVFLAYWVVLRASVGVSNFLFHHALHYRAGRYGTFRLEPSARVDRVLRFLLGTESVLILYEHPAHHAWLQVKARCLPDVQGAIAT
jgi:fatty acid desaturase